MFTLKPVIGKDFINRKNLVNEMFEELASSRSNIGFALYGNRRVGKTSILREIQRRLNDTDGCVCIYFSIWELVPATVDNFIKVFSRRIIEGFRPHLPLKYRASEIAKMPATVIREMLKEAKLGVKLSAEIEMFLKFSLEKNADYSEMITKVFQLPEKLSKVCGIKCVMMMDEFPSIIDLKNGKKVGEEILGLIRTVLEEQKNTAICISGSIRKTMEASALLPSSPFYRQFELKEVKPFKKKDVKELLERNLKGTQLDLTDSGMDALYEYTAGIPFYIHFLGRKIFQAKGKIDAKFIENIACEFLAEEGDIIFSQELKALSPKEKTVVISISAENHTPSEIANFIGETENTTSRFLIYLIEKGVVEKEDGNYFLSDPVFERWVNAKYANSL